LSYTGEKPIYTKILDVLNKRIQDSLTQNKGSDSNRRHQQHLIIQRHLTQAKS